MNQTLAQYKNLQLKASCFFLCLAVFDFNGISCTINPKVTVLFDLGLPEHASLHTHTHEHRRDHKVLTNKFRAADPDEMINGTVTLGLTVLSNLNLIAS